MTNTTQTTNTTETNNNTEVNTMTTTTNNTPAFFINSLDRKYLGILNLDIKQEPKFEAIATNLNPKQHLLTVTKFKSGSIGVLLGQTLIGWVNSKDINPAELAKLLHNNSITFNRIPPKDQSEDVTQEELNNQFFS